MHRWLALISPILASAAFLGPAPAGAHYFSCDSVRERVMRVDDRTRWNDALLHAVRIWDELGSVNISITRGNSFELYVNDYRANDGFNGFYSCSNYLRLNSASLENRGYPGGPRNTVGHEFGHALHLDHSYSDQLMYAYPTSIQTPKGHDKRDYRSLWTTNGGCTGNSNLFGGGICLGVGPGDSPFGEEEPSPDEPELPSVDPGFEPIEGAESCLNEPNPRICAPPIIPQFVTNFDDPRRLVGYVNDVFIGQVARRTDLKSRAPREYKDDRPKGIYEVSVLEAIKGRLFGSTLVAQLDD